MTRLADVSDDYRVTMNTSEDKSMIVHLPDKIVRFAQMENRLRGLSLNNPKHHLIKEECNIFLNKETKESDDGMPALLSPNDDDHDSLDNDSSDEEFDDGNSCSGKCKHECKHDHEKKNAMQLLSTVNETKKFLSDSQQAKAKHSRKMMKALGSLTVADLKAIMRMNLMKDCKVSTQDANLAEKAHGPGVGSLKGNPHAQSLQL